MCRLGVCPQWLWSLDVFSLSTPTAIIHSCPMCFNPQLPNPQKIYPARSISQASAQFQVRDPTVEREGPVVPGYMQFRISAVRRRRSSHSRPVKGVLPSWYRLLSRCANIKIVPCSWIDYHVAMVSMTLRLFFLMSNGQLKTSKSASPLPISARSPSITLPHMQALASLHLHVRFKIHDGYDAGDEDLRKPSEKLTAEKLEMLDSAVIDPNDELTPAQKEQVRQLLARRIDAFALINPKSPSHTHLVEVELPLNPGAVPHRHAPSRLGIEGEKVVDKEVATMEKNGIIRKSNSAWASRVVLVTKKDGTVRFCTDYRDLNSKLQREDSPLPLTAEAIDRLSSGQGSRDSLFLCVLDLASGFWVLEGLAWDICMPYLDDIGIFSTGAGAPCEPNNRFLEVGRLEREAVFPTLNNSLGLTRPFPPRPYRKD
eukprot:scaffold17830_cov120-Isochrysis_galbana.AAC.1